MEGTGSGVRLQHPTGIAYAGRRIYIADSYNHKIKGLDPTTGRVETLIGTGQPGHADGPFSDAGLYEPEGVVAAGGNGPQDGPVDRLYIADTNNHLIRVADLRTGTLHTLALRGLERLRDGAARLHERPARRLAPVRVAPGAVTFTVDIELPRGHKLNADAPVALEVKGSGGEARHSFAAGAPLSFTLPINDEQDLSLDLTLYYCQAEDERLCMIDQARLIVPIRLADRGESAVLISYRVTAGADTPGRPPWG